MTTTAIAVFLSKQVGSLVAKKFGASVVERWTRHRAEEFLAGFVQVLAKEMKEGSESKDVDQKLDAILGDEKCSEVLFDAYRSVCFSKSKTLGPRIIGLLTGALVLEGRMSDENEDCVFKAGEELSDSELIDFFKTYNSYRSEIKIPKTDKNPYLEGDSMVVPWNKESRDSAWRSDAKIDISPLDMHEALGSWAVSLERIGVLASNMSHRQVKYEADGERHIDEDGVLDIYSTTIVFRKSATLLYDLVERALGASEKITT